MRPEGLIIISSDDNDLDIILMHLGWIIAVSWIWDRERERCREIMI